VKLTSPTTLAQLFANRPRYVVHDLAFVRACSETTMRAPSAESLQLNNVAIDVFLLGEGFSLPPLACARASGAEQKHQRDFVERADVEGRTFCRACDGVTARLS